MQKNTYRLLTEKFGISEKVLELIGRAEEKAAGKFAELDDIRAYNQYKVLDIFRKNKISDRHFAWNTGYGYDDAGREALESVYAGVFGAESAIVRPLIVNGTHALTLTLTEFCGREMKSSTVPERLTIRWKKSSASAAKEEDR